MVIHLSLSSLASSSRLCFALVVIAISSQTTSAGAENLHSDMMPNLPFGDINVVILTDVHSWVGSHRRQEPYYDADLGDILSFWGNLKEQCEGKQDLFLVNNGDFVDGTGLSETIDGENDPEYLIPLLEKMPYDAVNVGNHELYHKKNIEYMMRPGGYVDWWGDRYLTSNINRVDEVPLKDSNEIELINKGENKKPLGNRYKVLHGENSKLLVFGFLYNMRDYAKSAGIEIEHVETTVNQQWFLDALSKEDYDAILVLSHMDLVDPLVETMRSAIRNAVGESIPVVFVTGHTHYRGHKQLKGLTMTFEAGRFLDTVGFVSLPKKEASSFALNGEDNDDVFGHKFLDTNRKVLFEDVLGFSHAEDGETHAGREFSAFIEHTRKKLGLEDEIGCAPHSYFVKRHLDAPDSLWGLYRNEVVPKIFPEALAETKTEEESLPVAMLLSEGDWRYDLYSNSSIVVDDVYAIAPFNDTIIHMGNFSADVILEANKTLNHKSRGILPRYVLIGDLATPTRKGLGSSSSNSNSNQKYNLYTHDFEAGTLKSTLSKLAPSETVEISKTEHTSSLIWLAYIRKYWPCNGDSFTAEEQQPPVSSFVPPPVENSKMNSLNCLGNTWSEVKNYSNFWWAIGLLLGLGISMYQHKISQFQQNCNIYKPVDLGDECTVSSEDDVES